VGVAIDSLDVVSTVVERARGRVSVWTLIPGGGGAAMFAALGLTRAEVCSRHLRSARIRYRIG